MSKHIFTIPAISGIEIVSGALELSASILPLARGPAGPPGILGSFTIAELNTAINDADVSITTHNHTGVYEPLKGSDDNYVTDAQLIIIGNTSGINTGDNPGVTSVSGTSPVASSGGNTPTISMPAATNASSGYATAAHIQAIEANTAKVSNATHTGDATGSNALTVVGINGTNLAGLATGILKNTTGTGIPTIAVAGDFPVLNQNTTGSAATLTTPRTIDGQTFNGSSNITVIAPGTYNAANKTTPIDNDLIPLVDSAASNGLAKLSWSNLKATIKTYLDTLYNPIIPTYTWATLPAASSLTGYARVSDVGINGSLWYSNGSVWKLTGPTKIFEMVNSLYLVPSLATANAATYSQTGTTITVDNGTAHNIPATTYDGANVYISFTSGLATSGWFTNFQRTGANTFTCVSTVSQTTSGNCNTMITNVMLPSSLTKTLPANVLDSRRIICNSLHTNNNNANQKISRPFFNGTIATLLSSISTTTAGQLNNGVICNRANSNNSQINSGGGITSFATASSMTLNWALNPYAPNDFSCLEMAVMELV